MNKSDDAERIRLAIKAEIEQEQHRPAARSAADYAGLLAAFLRGALDNLGRSPADFARALDIDQELADGILDGLLPVSQIEDEFLVEIARAVGHQPNVLRVMLGRGITPARSEENV